MNLGQSKNLGKSVEVSTYNRPVKVVYLVPFDETSIVHMIVDAVFHESYTRWAGAYTLIVPTTLNDFLHPEYANWMEFFDPDFVYTFVDLEQNIMKTINKLCSPIAFLKHEPRFIDEDNPRWRDFVPDWRAYFDGVSSITTIPFDSIQNPQIATQQFPGIETRFIRDNFGISFNTSGVTHEIPGFYKTLCLVPQDLPDNHIVGTERCTSIANMFSEITKRKVHPVAKFSMLHADSIPRVAKGMWAQSFNLIIGNTVLDRIHFWNSRHFTPSYSASLGSLILETSFFDNSDLLSRLGTYLNRNNFLGQHPGPPKVSISSYSHTKEELDSFEEKLRKHTCNLVHVANQFNLPPIPERGDLEKSFFHKESDVSTFKVADNFNTLIAKEPSHFSLIPPQYKYVARGQWIVELNIQRHNNLSKYSNVVDAWVLPKRRKIVQAFTKNLGKITNTHRLAILPVVENNFPNRGPISQKYFYSLSIVEDEVFFQHLLLDIFKYPQEDLCASIETPSFQDFRLSDKGQNLRGVISMFDNLSDAWAVLTNKFWREVLRAGNTDSTKALAFLHSKLESFLPNDHATKNHLKTQLNLDDIGKVQRFMKNNLTDTLEYLVKTKVFYLVHQWRCRYCGHTNSRSFDDMKIENSCDICPTTYFSPIDLVWTYQLNDFVFRSLIKHTGLPVLWTLGYLKDELWSKSFWYLPEVDLFETYGVDEGKNEIDILCVSDGKFIAVEVKRSVSQLIENSEVGIKFSRKMNLIQPDIAILSFERYCHSDEEIASTKASMEEELKKIRQSLAPDIKLKVIVAQDVPSFNDFPTNLGDYGRRTASVN